MRNGYAEDVLKTCSRRLGDQKMFAGKLYWHVSVTEFVKLQKSLLNFKKPIIDQIFVFFFLSGFSFTTFYCRGRGRAFL